MESDPHLWIAALRGSHDRLVDELAQVEVNGPSYCSEWTIAQVVSHLGSGAEIARMSLEAMLAGEPAPSPDRYPAIWDRWNAKAPLDQVRDGVSSDLRHVRLVEGLSDAELSSIHVPLFGMEFDAVGVLGLRLSEHAVHTWDVAVTRDPAAGIAPDAAALLIDRVPAFAAWIGRPSDVGSLRVRVRTTAPDRSFLIEVADGKLEITPSAGAPDLSLSAEAFIRLVYGRLDSAEIYADISADAKLRKLFPGF